MKAMRKSMSPAIASGLRLSLVIGLFAGCLADDNASRPAAGNHALAARPADPVKTTAMLTKAKSLVRPGSVVQTEPRLGVPTFLWTRDASLPSSRARLMVSGQTDPEVAAARAVLADYAPLYGLSGADVDAAVVAGQYRVADGPILVKLHAQVGGVEVFGEELTVIMKPSLEPVAISGYLSSTAAPSGSLAFGLPAAGGAARAVSTMARTAIDASLLRAAGSRDGYDFFDVAPAAGLRLDEPARLKKVYFPVQDGFEAAYYVEVQARTGAPRFDIVNLDGSPTAASEAYAFVVSAATGEVLFRKNLIADIGRPGQSAVETNDLGPGGFTYRVWADPVTGVPYDTPAGNEVHPKVDPVPDGRQEPFVATSDVTLPNFPFSRNDPWLATGATETVGNNVDAFLNLLSPDGFGNPTTTTPR